MNTYKDCINFIENKLGIQLLTYQKEFIRSFYEQQNLWIIYPRHCGRYESLQHLIIFYEIFKEEKKYGNCI